MTTNISLHDHLDGALRPATVIDLAREVGHRLPHEEPAALGEWFRRSADSGSLERYLTTFEHTVAVMQTESALERVAQEYVLDCAADGVIHAEVRWAPEQHVRRGLTLEGAVAAVARGLARGAALVREGGGHISVVQILCAMRHLDRSTEIARLVVREVEEARVATGGERDGLRPGEPAPGTVVGFDLAGPEAGFRPSRHREALDLLAEHLVPVTLHAGEADDADSVREAVELGRAQRIGHGVRLLDEDPHGNSDLARWVRDRRITLEVCPSSNLQTGAGVATGTGIAGHPVTGLLRSGFTVTVSPDNRLISGTSISREFALLREHAGWSDQDVLDVRVNAARAAFVPREYQEDLERRVRGECSEVPRGSAAAFTRLVSVMDRLRSPDGCPWDAQQTHESLVRYLVEETYEVVESVEAPASGAQWRKDLVEELGDVLLQVVFHARIGQEHPQQHRFDVRDVIETVTEKLVRRHPHVFPEAADDASAPTAPGAPPAVAAGAEAPEATGSPATEEDPAALSARWDAVKRAEKPDRTTVFAGIPMGLPALALAEKALSKARRHGVEPEPAVAQDGEAAASAAGRDLGAHERELGDWIFDRVREASGRGLDAERALRTAVRRYVAAHDRDL